MEFRDLKRQYQELKTEIDKAVINVMTNAHFIMGDEVRELERLLASYVGRKYCVTCANGTDALLLAMMALGIKAGDAVFVPDFTFFSTAEIVAHIGAMPIMVDVDEKTFNISVSDLEVKIKETLNEKKYIPKAIIPVDLFGLPADYNNIIEIADKYGLSVVEDGAQGFGGSLNGRRACSFGGISTTSFFPAKPLGCYGDGGAIFTDNKEIAELLQSYRIHGKGKEKYDNIRIGLNSRLDTIQAAVLIEKFRAFDKYEVEDINQVAQIYSKELKGIVEIPTVPEGYTSSWAQYTIRLKNKESRDSLKKFLQDREIPSMIYYPRGMHQQTAFKDLKLSDDMYPVTTRLCETVLSLPIHPYMKKEEIICVCDAIKEFI